MECCNYENKASQIVIRCKMCNKTNNLQKLIPISLDFSRMLYTFANEGITNNRLMVVTHSLNGFHSPSTEYILLIRGV